MGGSMVAVRLAPTLFGIALIAIWAVSALRSPKPKDPSDLADLQHNLTTIVEHTSVRTALLTAGLISIAFGLA